MDTEITKTRPNRFRALRFPPSSSSQPALPDAPSDDDRLYRRAALLIALVAVAARFWMAWVTHSTAEDFLITLRYAENLAGGHGFAYNPGERVLGTTTPLYTLLLALAAWLRFDAALVGKACSILADGLTCYLLARLLARREIRQPVAGLFAALLYALSSTPVNISIGGMETALVTCAGLAAIHAYVAGRRRVLCVLGAVLFLLRIDGLLLFALLVLPLAVRQRRWPWRDLTLGLALALPWLIFAQAYFGSPIPTSLIAKLTVYSHNFATSRAVIQDAFARQFLVGGVQITLTALFLAGAAAIIRQRDPRLGPPLLWLTLYYGAMFVSHVPPFPWYFLPPWPLVLGIAGLGAGKIAGWAGRGLSETARLPLRRLAPFALAAYGMFGVAHLRALRADIARTQAVEDSLRVPMGLWLGQQAGPRERILLEPIGYVGYYSRRPILDMIGLVSPEVFPSYDRPDFLADIVRRFRPAWLCLRPREAALLRRQAPGLLEAEYRYVREFHATARPPDFLRFHRLKP